MITIDKNKKYYIFDIDGTLTKPRMKMTKNFSSKFRKWAEGKKVILSSGSDFEKITNQIPENILKKCDLIFSCMSNEIRDNNGKILAKNDFIMPSGLELVLLDFVRKSNFLYRTGNHLEFRTGMLNFSTIGRKATPDQRKEYEEWDNQNKERVKIAKYINKNFPELEATVGGSISIDIIKKGADKGQTIKFLIEEGIQHCVFVGDRLHPGGNDYGIVRELIKSKIDYRYYNVLGPKETLKLITNSEYFKEV